MSSVPPARSTRQGAVASTTAAFPDVTIRACASAGSELKLVVYGRNTIDELPALRPGRRRRVAHLPPLRCRLRQAQAGHATPVAERPRAPLKRRHLALGPR